MKKTDFKFKDNQVFYGRQLLVGMVPEEFDIVHYKSERFPNLLSFVKDKRGIWLLTNTKKGAKFVTKDSANFVVISDAYAKDGTFVYEYYITLKKIPNADPNTFQVLEDSPSFAKDKNKCYAMSGSGEGLIIIDDADPETFGGCSWNSYAVDKDYLYYYNYHYVELANDSKFQVNINSANLSEDFHIENTFERNKAFLLEKYPNIKGWWHPEYEHSFSIPYLSKELYTQEELKNKLPFYHIENQSIYHCKYDDYGYMSTEDTSRSPKVRILVVPTLLRNVDHKSFEILNEYYAKDKNTVFYMHRKVLDIDVNSVQAVSGKFIKDKKNYFYNGYKIEGIDYVSFEPIKLDVWDYAKDDLRFYGTKNKRISKFKGYDVFMLPGIAYDKKSFEKIIGPWAKDKNSIYYEIIPFLEDEIDLKTFEVLKFDNFAWVKDKNNLYYLDYFSRPLEKIKGIDGRSFEKLNQYWGKDKNVVFNFEEKRIIKTLDVNTFEVLDANGKAQDKNFIYEYLKASVPKHLRDNEKAVKIYEGLSPVLKKRKRK